MNIMVKVINATKGKRIYLNVEYKEITVEELLLGLNIDKVQVGAVLINNIPKRMNDKITDDSEIYLLPVMEGG